MEERRRVSKIINGDAVHRSEECWEVTSLGEKIKH